MKKLALALVCVLLTGVSSAQQKIKSDKLDLISEIVLTGKLNVELFPAEENRLEVDLYNSDIKKFRWVLTDGKLDVHLRPTQGAYANVRIWCKDLDLRSITMTEGEFICNSELEIPMFAFGMSSSAKATLDVSCVDLELNIGSNSVLSMSGDVKYLQIKTTEKARVDTRQMDATSVNVEASMGAEVYVTALERLVAYPKTGATVFYKGDPTILKIQSSKVAGMGAGVHKIK